MIATLDDLLVSVIISTYNPRRDVLRRTLAGLGQQSLPPERWQLIVVDNNSSPRLEEQELCDAAGRSVQLIFEPRQGTLPARASGIKAAKADLLVFVDDDNFLYPDYLHKSLEIFPANPQLGAFGGRTEGIFERRLRDWHRPLLEYLAVRDFGDEAITSHSLEWGKWEPVGAGMVARRDGMDYYLNLADSPAAAKGLGRQGKTLLSCGDSLLAKSVIMAGYANSYQPSLRLKHFIKEGRFKAAYLQRLIAGMGQSLVKLNAMLDLPESQPRVTEAQVCDFLRGNAHYELTEHGRSGALLYYWSFGVLTETLGLSPGDAFEIFREARGRLRRKRRSTAHVDTPWGEVPEQARQQAQQAIRQATQLLPLSRPGEQLTDDDTAWHDACRCVREAALLVTNEVPSTVLPWQNADGLRTITDGGKPFLHLGVGRRTLLTVPTEHSQAASLLVEARPLCPEVTVDFLLNGSLVRSSVLHRAAGNRRFLLPLELDAGDNAIMIQYRNTELTDPGPMMLYWMLALVPDNYWSSPESIEALQAEVPATSPAAIPRVVPSSDDAKTFQRISIVIPNYNTGHALERAILSLLRQDYPNLEIILIDGGSTDASLQIMDKYRTQLSVVVSEPDQGQADGLNKGFRLATGQIRGWLCADDELLPGTLHTVNHLFAVNPECQILTGGCERIYADGKREITRPPANPWETLGMRLLIEQPSTFWRTELHQKVGELDISYRLTFDWDFWARFRETRARLMTTAKPLSRYYFTEDNKTSSAGSGHAEEHLRIIRRYGPLDGLVADCYQLLYHFDLRGCLDRRPKCPPEVAESFWKLRNTLGALVGQRHIELYNLHFASLQERGMIWWK